MTSFFDEAKASSYCTVFLVPFFPIDIRGALKKVHIHSNYNKYHTYCECTTQALAAVARIQALPNGRLRFALFNVFRISRRDVCTFNYTRLAIHE